MATCYAPPEEFQPPSLEACSFNYDEYAKVCNEFDKSLSQWCRANSSCPDAGKIIGFPFADGYARYAILDYRTLIHINTYDGWDIPPAHMRGLRKMDIVAAVKRTESPLLLGPTESPLVVDQKPLS